MASTHDLRTGKAKPSFKWDMPEGLVLALICGYSLYVSKEALVAILNLESTTSLTQGIMGSWIKRAMDSGPMRASVSRRYSMQNCHCNS